MTQTPVNSNSIETKKFTFDKSFQEKIVQAMILDRIWASQFSEVLEVEYFQYAYLKLIVGKYLNYYKTYKEFPTAELLGQIIAKNLKETGADSIIRDQIKEFFMSRIRTDKDLTDLPYVKEQSLQFCKRSAIHKALIRCVELANSEKLEDQEKIFAEVKKAASAGNENTVGLDLFEEISARYSETYRRTIGTGIKELDQREILNGGLGAGELGVVVAASGVGKSHILVHLGCQAILQGKNVVYYTLELNERMTGIRFDSHLMGINSSDCYKYQDIITKFYKDNADKLGKLRIKYYPTGGATVSTLRSHLDKLAAQGFRPDLVIVDYAGIMRSTERYELLRLELKKISEELRGFAGELDIPVWTALQSNKEGANAEVVDMTNLAEAFAQAHIADFILGIARPTKIKSTGYCTIHIAKNRAGRDGISLNSHLDTARSKLRVLTSEELSERDNNISSREEESSLETIRRISARSYTKDYVQ